MNKLFFEKFQSQPTLFIRAPGRVNLIGEHIDYSGYGVLPMAIEQAATLLIEPTSDGTLTLANSNSQFKLKEIKNAGNDIQIDSSVHEWTNYILAGFKVTFIFLVS